MLTLLCVMVAWVFFRARGFEDAQRILACMFSVAGCAGTHGPPPGEGVVSSYRAGWITAMWFAASFAAAVVGRNSQQWVDGPYAAAMRRVSSSAWRTLALGAIIGAEVTAI